MTARIRCVLFGVGRMGKHHLRVIKQNQGFELGAIIDPERPLLDPEICGTTPLVGEIDEIGLDAFDVAFVAAPTLHHHAVVHRLIDAGKHVFVEKPLASSFDECTALVRAAAERNVRLAVGHVERFNPAVRMLREVIRSGRIGAPLHFSFTRVGGHSERMLRKSNVLLELAVHDLDILRSVIGNLRVKTCTFHSSIQPGVYDAAFVTLSSQSGISATIDVNWNAPHKVRTIQALGTRAACFVDCMLQTCTLFESEKLSSDARSSPAEGSIVQHPSIDRVELRVHRQEPLIAQLAEFHRLLVTGEAGELCLGEDGSAAVLLAERGIRIAGGRESGQAPNQDSCIGTTPSG